VTLTGGYTNLVELDTTPKILNVYPLNGAYQETIALGSNKTLWVGGSAQYQVVTRFTSDHQVRDFPVTCASGIWGLAAGPDGNMWFTGATDSRGRHYVSKITPSGTITEYRIQSQGSYIIAGPDGKMWFTEPFYGLIGKVTMTGVVSEYKIPHAIKNSKTQYQVSGIVAGPDGNLWFTEPMHSRIGEVVLPR
jgi:streptogramin lyase